MGSIALIGGVCMEDTEKSAELSAYEKECGERMEAIAKSRGLTQLDIADAFGVTQGMISHYYRGRKRITMERLVAFCSLARCAPWEIDPKSDIAKLFHEDEQELFAYMRAHPDRAASLAELLLNRTPSK